MINRKSEVIEKFSSGTSACVYNRLYYLARGGNDEEFTGWGYEDLEFNLRVARLTKRFPIPENFTLDHQSFDAQYDYRGWKAIYRLFGDRSMMKGIMLFHAWHPVDRQSTYYNSRAANKRRFDRLIADFSKFGTEPQPLPDPLHGRSLVLKKSAFTYQRTLRPLLGEVIDIGPENLPGDEALGEWLEQRRIDRIVFQNPYASEDFRRIYDWARKSDFPFVICERGALPNSILFDRTGFLADSSNFAAEHWDVPLTEAEEKRLSDYIQHETRKDAGALEKQSGARLQPRDLRAKLGITSADTVVLICLQRPSDTATRFFTGDIGTYPDFVDVLERLSVELPPNVRLLFKVHPLEDHIPAIQGTNVSAFHINDLLAIADKLVVYTSGTGVLGMLWNVPLIICGNAFYKNPKLTKYASARDELREYLLSAIEADREAYRRFLHYLRFRYYSFGTFSVRDVLMPDGSRMTATTDIKFESIRNFGREDMMFAARSQVEDSWQSMLFDRYVGENANNKSTVRRPAAAPSKPAPAVAPAAKPAAAPAAAPKVAAAPKAPAPPVRPSWGVTKSIVHLVSRLVLSPALTPEDRRRLAVEPVDFFGKAKWAPNRFFGRLLLDKSLRTY